jgi:hypothetical protein
VRSKKIREGYCTFLFFTFCRLLYCRVKCENLLYLCTYICGASKIKLKKVNKKRTVTVRSVIIFLNISRHPLLICLQCCLHQYKSLKAMEMATAAIVLLTPAKNFKKVFWGFLVVSPLFNHFLR